MTEAQTAEPGTFEEEYGRLEAILEVLEDGELGLEESLREYERGVRSLLKCREVLAAAEQRVEELSPSGLVPSALGGEDSANDER